MNTKIVILAAGRGTRMKTPTPKVVMPIVGKPMIKYLIESIMESGVDSEPVIVVSPDNREVIAEQLKEFKLTYVNQEVQLGTGHALACARQAVDDSVEKVIVLYGDHPFIKAPSIKMLNASYMPPVTMMITRVEDFNDWRKSFYQWGRVIRDGNKIRSIIEFKDADEKMKEIREVNPAMYCFDRQWVWDNIGKINNENAQREYYLTELMAIAFNAGQLVHSVEIEPIEAIGINSREELALAEEVLKNIGI